MLQLLDKSLFLPAEASAKILLLAASVVLMAMLVTRVPFRAVGIASTLTGIAGAIECAEPGAEEMVWPGSTLRITTSEVALVDPMVVGEGESFPPSSVAAVETLACCCLELQLAWLNTQKAQRVSSSEMHEKFRRPGGGS